MRVVFYPWPSALTHVIVIVEETANGTRGQVGSFSTDADNMRFYEYVPLMNLSDSEQMDVRLAVADETARHKAIRDITKRLLS